MAMQTTATTQSASWLDSFKRDGYYYRQVAILTIVCGVYLHLTRLFIGDDLLIRHVFTPLFDILLAIPMTYAGIAGLLAWRRMQFTSLAHKLFQGFILFYVTASIPLHVATIFTQSTDYIRIFPMAFSLVLLPYYALVITALWRLHFKER